MSMNASTVCPCCGQELPKTDDIRVDLDGGFIVARGFVVQPTASEFRLFEQLWGGRPRTFTKDQLMEELYWRRSSGEEVEPKILDVYVCKLRKRLEPLGIRIETVWGSGYRIPMQGEAANG